MIIGGLACSGVVTFVVLTFVAGGPALVAELSTAVDAIVNWLATGPLHLRAGSCQRREPALPLSRLSTYRLDGPIFGQRRWSRSSLCGETARALSHTTTRAS